MATTSKAEAEAEADVVYVVYCHDGDEDIGKPGSDISLQYIHDPWNIDAHYYAIYALPMPEPVPLPSYFPGKDELLLSLSSSSKQQEKKPKLDLPPSPHQPNKEQEAKLIATLSLTKFPHCMGFAAFGSCIYMLGGRSISDDPSLEVYIIDTSRPLDPCNVPKGPPLQFPKINPIVVTVLGKIFAIPVCFGSEEDWKRVEFLDLFSGSNKWEQIPSPKLIDNILFQYQNPYFGRRMKRFSGSVGSCNVMGSSLIVVTLLRGSVFELDAANPLEGWKEAATRFDVITMGAITGTSELFDALLCFHEQPPNYYEKGFCFSACLHPDLDNARQFPKYIPTLQPTGWKASGGMNRPMGRRVLRIGDGRAAVLTHGTTGDGPNSLHLHFVIDIVSLDIVKLDPDRDKEEDKEDPWAYDTALFLHRLDTVDYKIGKVNTTYGCLCCCFRMLGSSKTFATTPSVNRYDDTVVYSRNDKYRASVC